MGGRATSLVTLAFGSCRSTTRGLEWARSSGHQRMPCKWTVSSLDAAAGGTAHSLRFQSFRPLRPNHRVRLKADKTPVINPCKALRAPSKREFGVGETAHRSASSTFG